MDRRGRALYSTITAALDSTAPVLNSVQIERPGFRNAAENS
jgi:hypothetical protein